MELGAFSVSLNVKDIKSSFEFYKKLGFTQMGGDISQNWIILKNKDTIIGLFQGMFEKNTLTFNPGWDSNAAPLDKFTDVRELEKQIKSNDIDLLTETTGSEGPGYLIIEDPDGNPILIDQHR